MNLLKIGVVGCGSITEEAHLPILSKLRGKVKVVALVDLNIKKTKDLSKKYNIPRIYENHIQMIDNEDIDIVDICTPPRFHSTIALDALRNGLHVLVEKPMTLSVSEAQELVNASKKYGVKLCVIQNYRYVPSIRLAKIVLEEDRLGKILSAYTIFHQTGDRSILSPYLCDPELSGSILFETLVHEIDLIYFLLGEIKSVFTMQRDFYGTMGFDNDVKVLLETKSGTVAFCDVSWVSGTNEHRLELLGTAGHVLVDLMKDILNIKSAGTSLVEESFKAVKDWLSIGIKAIKGELWGYIPHFFLFEDFLKCVKENTNPPVSAEEALNVIKILEACRKSIDKKTIINL